MFVGSVAVLHRDIAASASQRWLLSCRDALEFLVALFAVWHAGRTAVVPVNFQKEQVHDAASAADEVISGVLLTGEDPGGEWGSLDPLASRLILQTSGSTGAPKSIEKTLFQLDAELSVLEFQWGLSLQDARIAATVPHYHIYGLLFRLLWPVASGRAFIIEELSMPDDIQSGIACHAPAALVSSPSHLERIPSLMRLGDMAPHIVRIFSSGSPLSPATAALYTGSLGIAPTEVLGSTETGGVAWREGGSEWTPFCDVDVRLATGDALEVRSPRTPLREWHVTGDGAEFMDGGCFRLTGRLDRVAKIEGKRISLDDLEKKLSGHAGVSNAGVVVLEGDRKILGAVVAMSPDGRMRLDREGRSRMVADLKAHLAQWFEPVMIPKQWRFVDRLPADERGKITVSGLAALFSRRPELPEK